MNRYISVYKDNIQTVGSYRKGDRHKTITKNKEQRTRDCELIKSHFEVMNVSLYENQKIVTLSGS